MTTKNSSIAVTTSITLKMRNICRDVVVVALAVAQEVAEYNKQIFAWWMNSTPNWKSIISKQIAATKAWDYNTTASFEAVP